MVHAHSNSKREPLRVRAGNVMSDREHDNKRLGLSAEQKGELLRLLATYAAIALALCLVAAAAN